ncbi:uncharacterized protein LOC143579698 [Bidens hawaiensis]|uniref:uncharacterized protein LOC143579698 n=1 Tax=Bidens hawaiensis TaxID=980011 RepID=UPI00404B709C
MNKGIKLMVAEIGGSGEIPVGYKIIDNITRSSRIRDKAVFNLSGGGEDWDEDESEDEDDDEEDKDEYGMGMIMFPYSKRMSNPSTSSGPAVPFIPETHSISILPAPPPPPKLPDPKRPIVYIEGSSREEYINVGIPLYEAALKGDWKAVEPILKNRPDLVGYAITENHETVLHIAASAKSAKAVEFVKNLVDFMGKDDLELQNKSGDTALNSAAQAGNLEIAMAMVEKNPGLLEIPNNRGLMPLYLAALFAKPEMVRYLYGISKKMSGDFWTDRNRGWVLQKCVDVEIFDVAIKIVNDIPILLNSKALLHDLLSSLAHNTDAFEEKKNKSFQVNVGPFEKVSEARQLLKIIWGKIAKRPKRDIDDIIRGESAKVKKKNKEKEGEVMEKGDTSPTREIEKEKDVKKDNSVKSYPSRLLFVAAKMGNASFLTELIRLYPDVVWQQDDKGQTIFHLAIKQRNVEIYKVIYEIGAMKDLIIFVTDNDGNNILHMTGKGAKRKLFQNVSGVAFQM